MSRLGKIPVAIPNGVQVKLDGQRIEIKGAKGTLTRVVPDKLTVEVKDNAIHLAPNSTDEDVKAFWGLYRVLISNMVTGVSAGFKIELEIQGVGYKAELKGKDLNISAGFSSPVLFKARPGVTFTVEGGVKIAVEGLDNQAVGQAAADIRRIRPPEPYKGKGIRYLGEAVRRKAGKAAGK